MNRIEIIQHFIESRRVTRYLEIGVFEGNCFFALRGAIKSAVDPAFKFGFTRKLTSSLKNPWNCLNSYYEMTSDEYFGIHKARGLAAFDLVFIDGLHTYKQSLADVLASIQLLSPNGWILVHDCNPSSEAEASPEVPLRLPGWSAAWCGEVWKTIVYLRSRRPDLRVSVIDCDYGVGAIQRGVARTILPYTEAEIEAFTYRVLEANRENLLGLESPDTVWKLIAGVR